MNTNDKNPRLKVKRNSHMYKDVAKHWSCSHAKMIWPCDAKPEAVLFGRNESTKALKCLTATCCFAVVIVTLCCLSAHTMTHKTHIMLESGKKKIYLNKWKTFFFSQALVENVGVIPRVCKRCRREMCASKLQVLIQGLWCQQRTML